MKTLSKTTMAAMLLAMLGLAGCHSNAVEADFGNSVRAMRQAQTMNPATIDNPDTTPVTYTDGQRMENALKSYRENVGNPVQTQRPLQINIDE